MRPSLSWLLLAACCSFVACSQPDGPMPTLKNEDPNRIGDVGRDLVNVRMKIPGAPKDLFDDLQNLAAAPPPDALTQRLGESVSQCLTARPINEQATQQLAHHLFVVMNSRELSRRQVRRIADEVGEVLKSTGGDEAGIARVKETIEALYASIAMNRKRWYHLF